jgi:Flagellar basal body-associated protein
MAEEVKGGGQDPPKKGKKLLLLILIAFLIIGIGAGAFLLLSFKKGEDEKGKKAKKAERVVVVDLDPIIVNLFDPTGRRYLQVRLSFEVSDKKAEEQVKKQEAKLKDAIISILSGKTVEEVIVPEAKDKIKREILAKCKEIFGEDVVTNVYITQYIVE